jgi:predicted phosphatase
MDPITWITVANLLVKYGPEVVDFIIKKAHAGDVVTPEEWNTLKLLSQKSAASQLSEAFKRAGVEEQPELVAMLPKI